MGTTAAEPSVFSATGGTGRIRVQRGPVPCVWHELSEVDWIHIVGASSYLTGAVDFLVAPNTTGAKRSGTIVIGETRVDIMQQP